jgi:hypothetical protein
MTLFNSADPDIRFAQTCVLNTLASIRDEHGAIFDVAADQKYLADMVQKYHDRNRQIEAAKTLNRPGRKGRRRVAPVIDITTKRAA